MFPEWMTKINDDTYQINADIAYPALLQELAGNVPPVPEEDVIELPWIQALRELDPEKPTQYWIEVIYQMAKLDLRRVLLLNGLNAWPNKINIKGDKNKWSLKLFPKGRGVEAATKGREAREHYRRLRGFIPN